MQFYRFAILGALMGLSAANHIQTTNVEIDILCTDVPPSTVTTTVTVTAPPATITGSSWVKTVGGTVTSCDYSGSQTTVYVWPTGSASQDVTVVIYQELTVIQVAVVNLNVVINNDGQTSTVTVTKTDTPTYTPPPPPPQSTTATTSTSTSTAAKQTHTVQVGALGELIYGPNQLNAAIGDIVRFDFLKLNHSVTQSSFAKPCTYNGGFDTGLNQFNPQNISGKFLVDFQVNTTAPLWFYW
jgi:plastocyanin